jgi:hypothetical protein
VAFLGFTLGQHSVSPPEKKYTDRIVKSVSCEFPSVFPNVLTAEEFEQSPLYSMYWVNESARIDQEILLIKAEQFDEIFGYGLCFVKARREIRKKYTIIETIPMCISGTRNNPTNALPTNALLLEVEPKQTEQKQ